MVNKQKITLPSNLQYLLFLINKLLTSPLCTWTSVSMITICNHSSEIDFHQRNMETCSIYYVPGTLSLYKEKCVFQYLTHSLSVAYKRSSLAHLLHWKFFFIYPRSENAVPFLCHLINLGRCGPSALGVPSCRRSPVHRQDKWWKGRNDDLQCICDLLRRSRNGSILWDWKALQLDRQRVWLGAECEVRWGGRSAAGTCTQLPGTCRPNAAQSLRLLQFLLLRAQCRAFVLLWEGSLLRHDHQQLQLEGERAVPYWSIAHRCGCSGKRRRRVIWSVSGLLINGTLLYSFTGLLRKGLDVLPELRQLWNLLPLREQRSCPVLLPWSTSIRSQ